MSQLTRILVHMPGPQTAAATIAATLSDRLGGRLVGLHPLSDPSLMVPLVGEGISGGVVEQMLSQAQNINRARADAAKAAFVQAMGGRAHDWLEPTGDAGEILARQGRLSDLLVMGRLADDDASGAFDTINAALMETGRPVLRCPDQCPAELGRHVAVAWKAGAEAARAVVFALPFLKQAEKVTLLAIDAPAPDDLAAYLAGHGITATPQSVRQPALDHHQAGQVLLAECQKIGADMLVMGAFSHSRLRQLVLGGVTRHILSHATIPCLMGH